MMHFETEIPRFAREDSLYPLLRFTPKIHPMDPRNLTVDSFQQHISDRYEKVDRTRGWPKTFAFLIEEVGELATALSGDNRENLEEEFADVIAWLCTLAN